MGELHTALQAGHCSLFKEKKHPKTWESQTCRCAILCLDSLFPTKGSQPSGVAPH